MKLNQIEGNFSVVRLEPQSAIPEWVWNGSFTSISKTEDELSVVCGSQFVPSSTKKDERNWCLLKVDGPLGFSLTGILSSIAKPLADDGISIFSISTFDTDYILVKSDNISKAVSSLERVGHQVIMGRTENV